MGSVAYFVASHKHREQILRLLGTLHDGSDPQDRVVVHHDLRAARLEAADLERWDRVELMGRGDVQWGGSSQIDMVLGAIRHVVDRHDPDWLVYLSGQDYPLRPLPEAKAQLEASGVDGFVDVRPSGERHWQSGAGRYLYTYPRWKGLPAPAPVRRVVYRRADRLAARGIDRAPRVNLFVQGHRIRPGWRRSPFGPGGLVSYEGSSWWTLGRRALASILAFTDQRPDYLQHFARVAFAPNEGCFTTIVANDPALRLVTDDNLRYIRWSQPGTGHPDVLRAEDLPALAASGAHFGRKVDPTVDPRLVDLLDEVVGERVW